MLEHVLNTRVRTYTGKCNLSSRVTSMLLLLDRVFETVVVVVVNVNVNVNGIRVVQYPYRYLVVVVVQLR